MYDAASRLKDPYNWVLNCGWYDYVQNVVTELGLNIHVSTEKRKPSTWWKSSNPSLTVKNERKTSRQLVILNLFISILKSWHGRRTVPTPMVKVVSISMTQSSVFQAEMMGTTESAEWATYLIGESTRFPVDRQFNVPTQNPNVWERARRQVSRIVENNDEAITVDWFRSSSMRDLFRFPRN